MKLFLFSAIVICVFVNTSSGSSRTFSEDYVGFKYADLVVMGTVTEVKQVTYTGKELYGWKRESQAELLVPARHVEMEVSEVLRGSWNGTKLRFVVLESSSYETNHEVGQRVVVSCIPRSDLGVEYQLWADSGRFIWDGKMWICQSARPEARELTSEQLRGIARETTLSNVYDKASLIADAEVRSLRSYQLEGEDGAVSRILEVGLRLLKVYKGNPEGREISMVVVESGYYSPAWRRAVPLNYQVGERWIAFLKPCEQGYYPFAGSNGLLRVVGTELVYFNRRKYELNLQKMRSFLETEVSP